MAPRRPPIPRAHPAAPKLAPLVLAAVMLGGPLGGCAEVHRGAEAVGRIGGAPAPAAVAAEDDAAPPRTASRTDVKTVRPRGAPRTPARDAGQDVGAVEPAAPPAVVATAVPSPRQIFDFHPAGSRPDSWRQPFLIDTSDGPLAADVRRSSAELKSFLADQKAGAARRGATETAGVDGLQTGTARRRCGEMDIASGKPGCVVPRPPQATPR